MFSEFHIDDFNRPEEIQTLDMNDPRVFKSHLIQALKALHSRMPPHLTFIMVDLSDVYILELLLRKTMQDYEAFLSLNEFVRFCADLVYTACVMQAVDRFDITTPEFPGDNSESEEEGEGGDGEGNGQESNEDSSDDKEGDDTTADGSDASSDAGFGGTGGWWA